MLLFQLNMPFFCWRVSGEVGDERDGGGGEDGHWNVRGHVGELLQESKLYYVLSRMMKKMQ